ncbi:lipoprotein signal peptidase [Salmonella enterica subsp. enterica]|uniref:Lipoprotein signal peptidase n=1 Tax=Salmonella enterica I TaxID=59201 RepID=A0A447PU67_SALET|nr:lipoprotein signal peptidase [Salmonella enterica subsp. enterica]
MLIIDLGSKYLILQNFALGDTVGLFPSLNLHYARNYGAAFSFLADSGGWQRCSLPDCDRDLRNSFGDDVSLESDAEAE